MSMKEDSYICFGYASKQVENEFKSFMRNFSTLTEAINALGSLSHYLNYSFVYKHKNKFEERFLSYEIEKFK